MEKVETPKNPKDHQKSQGSAEPAQVAQPGAPWSEEEQRLAREYNVECKTVRLIGQVVEHRLEARGGAADVKLTPEAEAVEAPEDAECEVTTGIERLDRMLWRASYPDKAATYACMGLAKKDRRLGEKIEAALKAQLQPWFEELTPDRDADGPLDSECDVAPATAWLTLLDGFKGAEDAPVISGSTVQGSETAQESIEAAVEFLDVHLSRSTQEDKVAYFVFFDIASKPGVVADRVRAVLYEYAKPYIGTIGWEEEARRHDDPETILNMHRLLNVWRQLSGQGVVKEVPASDGPTDTAPEETKPEPESIEDEPETVEQDLPQVKKFSMDRRIDDANPAEKVIVDWLLKQDYKTKLACVMLSTMHIGDHGTDGIVNDIIGRWTTEILENSANPPENLTPQETVMTGAVVEMQLWEENF